MRYLLARCPATDGIWFISEPTELPGGPDRTIPVPCWAGCPVGTTHDLVELPSLAAVDALEAETEKAQRAAVESVSGVRTPRTGPEAPQTASQPRESHPEDSPPTDSARMSGGTRISTGGAR